MNKSIPVVSKIFCSGTPTMLMIRRRPIVVNGGGFVVTDLSHNIVFVVDGCGILGSKGELMVKDGEGEPILSISKKGGIVQALSTRNKWNGYSMDYQGKNTLVFSLTDPKSCTAQGAPIRIHIEPKRNCKNWDFEIGGSFADRDCTIVDCTRKIVAQVCSAFIILYTSAFVVHYLSRFLLLSLIKGIHKLIQVMINRSYSMRAENKKVYLYMSIDMVHFLAKKMHNHL
ncbi:protein LURP-one-related 6 isoform X1 [Sorghum bicolor]|uniref:protein LURP-one-related 6 isoform X1 n=1 Tax=Sorghum bicolor TaxID=4558 RepID=UPI000B425367|nr:protein LURP-one-related 6 isoform X1 [Sorghum bicolor]|eukprot:XP_021318094.1 protein LURP-one-related 6 isoform X1 [Sorghum bicolor]